ncbi:WYL domain-containing protein, partial [Bifidobacterium animalis]|nr:WYL domain-containing protein [Bifidobacterium animalis]
LPPADRRSQAVDLYDRLRRYVEPGQTPWLSLTGYGVEPRSFGTGKKATAAHALLDMKYTDGSGRIRERL